jgi:hypothetical protein
MEVCNSLSKKNMQKAFNRFMAKILEVIQLRGISFIKNNLHRGNNHPRKS